MSLSEIQIHSSMRFSNTHEIPHEPIHPDYADPRQAVALSFDWPYIHSAIADTLGSSVEETDLGVFRFRSIQLSDISQSLQKKLEEVDENANQRIKETSLDFLAYFSGGVDNRGRSLSFCIWTGQAAAREALRNSSFHRDAARLAQEAYSNYDTRWYDLKFSRELGHTVLMPSLSIGK